MKILIKPDGDIVSVYSDKIPTDKLGEATVKRASNVEFNNETKQWEATLPSGKIIATGTSRDAVIKQEIAYLEERLHEL